MTPRADTDAEAHGEDIRDGRVWPDEVEDWGADLYDRDWYRQGGER